MRTSERDGLLVLLGIASGSADGWSYFGIGHAFVANMTGNTVLLGVSIFHLHTDFLHPLITILCYCIGTSVGTLLAHDVEPGSVWSRSVAWSLFLEALLLIGSEIAWIAIGYNPGPRASLILLGCVAAAIGVQSGAMIQLRIPGVVTTYITGTWTTMVNGLTLLGIGAPRVERDKARFEERFALQAIVLVAYFLSAVLTGWLFRHMPGLVGCVSAVAVLLAAAYGALRN